MVEYKQFAEFTNVEPMTILKHATTRWLSLETCVRRILNQWPALQSYFSSHSDVEKNGRVQRIAENLNNPEMKLYCLFLEFILGPLNEFNTLFQSDESYIGFLKTEMERLLRKFLTKFVKMAVVKDHSDDLTKVPYDNKNNQLVNEYLAIGRTARTFLADEEENMPLSKQQNFFLSVRKFYEGEVQKMLKKFPFKDPIFDDLAILNPKNRLTMDQHAVIRLAERFSVVKEEELSDFQVSDESELPSYDAETTRVDEYWSTFCKSKCINGSLRFPILSKLIQTIITIPNSNADSERMFSIVRKIHTSFRSQLNNDTICKLLSVKTNIDHECFEFKPSMDLCKSAKTATHSYIQEQKEQKEKST